MLIVGMFFSCENDLERVKVITASSEAPDRVMTDLHSYYSDSGIVRYEIISTLMEDYTEKEQKQIFKNGLVINYYSDSSRLVSQLQAEYAEFRAMENLFVARNNVIFTNFEKEQTLKNRRIILGPTYQKGKNQ